jgi:hypothetical protein
LIGESGSETASVLLTLASLDQHGLPPSARITVDAVICLDVLTLSVSRFALLIARLTVGYGNRGNGDRGSDRRASAQGAKEVTTAKDRLA